MVIYGQTPDTMARVNSAFRAINLGKGLWYKDFCMIVWWQVPGVSAPC